MKNLLLVISTLIFGLNSFAQDISLLAQATFYHSGIGNPSSTTFNIPAGNNRLMVVYVFAEREHRPNLSQNFPSGNNGQLPFNVMVENTPMTFRLANGSYFIVPTESSAATNTEYSGHMQVFYLSGNNLPVGNTNISVITPNPAKTTGDDMIISVAVYENVSAITTNLNLPAAVAEGWALNGTPNYGNTLGVFNLNAPAVGVSTIPVGRSATEMYYHGIAASTEEVALTLPSASPWQSINTRMVSNANGDPFPSGSTVNPQNEADGMFLMTVNMTGHGSTTPANLVASRTSSSRLQFLRIHTVALAPLAKPDFSGRVHLDNDGPSAINGPAFDGTDLFYVNVVNDQGIVVATSPVGLDGVFNIPNGIVVEGQTYTLALSNNAAPINSAYSSANHEAPEGFYYVGETLTGTGNDGIHDGKLDITFGTTGVYTIKFGINACLQANDDHYIAVQAGDRAGYVLENDVFNCGLNQEGTATLNNVDIKLITPATPINGGPVPILNTLMGEVDVPEGTPSSLYMIEYQICHKEKNSPCDMATILINVIVPVPVTLAHFDVYQKDRKVFLNWSTVKEDNNKGFAIERQSEGDNGWKTIDFVNTLSKNGTSSHRIDYEFIDAKAKNGVNQYRLRQIDFDGGFDLSEVRVINLSTINTAIEVYPNPTKDNINIKGLQGNERISIIDVFGKVVNESVSKGSIHNLSINTLSDGIYNLRIIDESGKMTYLKLVKQSL